MSIQWFSRLCILATILALTVTVFGAYVRLSHAGLSCPDWPGCYGQLLVPQTEDAVEQANQAFPQRPVHAERAWKEMIHRYLAAVLGLLILVLAISAWRRRHRPGQGVFLAMFLVVLVALQGALGMWTVTLLLKPIVVTAHLLGGLTTTVLLWWMALRSGGLFTGYAKPLLNNDGMRMLPWLCFGILLLYAQLFLGGWVSTNYAALACTEFPLCQGELLPDMDFNNALTPWHGLGRNYEGGILASEARVAIHFMHRVGALVVLVYLGTLACLMMAPRRDWRLRNAGRALLVVLVVQVGLGISNVVLGLPLLVAVAHNGVAALLLLTLVSVCHVIRPARVVI